MRYIHDRADIVWLNFTPQVGSEQKRIRPSLLSIKKAAQIANMISYSAGILIELALNDQLAAEGFKIRIKTEVA